MAASDKKRKGKSKINAAQAYKLGNRAAVNKARVAKRIAKDAVRKQAKRIRRLAAGKPVRGTARMIRRARARTASVSA